MLISHLRFKPVFNQLKYISLWGLLLSILIGCQPSLISIARISEKKVGKTVYLSGEVVHLAPFVDNAAYQIEDSTGRTWVVSDRQVPALGQTIRIKGKIEYQNLPFDEQNLGDFYVVELEQLPESDRR